MLTALIQLGLTILTLMGWGLVVAGCGRLFLACTTIRFASRGEGLFLAAAMGLVFAGYAVFILGCMGSLSPRGIGFLLITLVLVSAAGWRHPLRISLVPVAERSSWDRPASILLGFLLFACFLLLATPEIGKDALIYHLAVPKLYLAHQGFYFIPGNIFAGYPLLGEMHYILALFLKNDILAKMMHFAVLGAVLLGIALFVRHVFEDQKFPALTMLLFLSIPSVFAVSHTAYNDLFVTLFTLAALYSFLRWSGEKSSAWLIFCGIFSGAAAACKYTALLTAPLGCLGILFFAQRQKMSLFTVLRLLALYLAAAVVTGSPFYLKNILVTGNPVYPFFHSLFGGIGWDQDQARLYDIFIQSLGMGKGFWDYLLLPWNLSFRAKMDSPQFDGILGPLFLLNLPFLAGLRRWGRPVWIMLFYILFTFLFWAFSAQQIRYLIPLFPLLALVTGSILTGYRRRQRLFGFLLCIIAGSLVFNLSHLYREFTTIEPLRVSAGLESREDFIKRNLPVYAMYHFANRHLPPDSRILLLYMKNYTFLCERDCYSDAMFEAHTLQKILREESSPERVRNRLMEMGFTHLLYDRVYLLGEPSPLTSEEKIRFLALEQKHLLNLRSEGSYRLAHLRQADA